MNTIWRTLLAFAALLFLSTAVQGQPAPAERRYR